MTAELQNRVKTGVIGAAALLGLIIYGGWLGIFLIVMVISIGMIYEFSQIVFSLPDQKEKMYALLILTWLMQILNLASPQSNYSLVILSFIALFAYYLITAKRFKQEEFKLHFKELMYSVFGLVYLVFIPLYLIDIYESVNGIKWVILFLFIVWSGDTGAYFAGKKFGKRKLYPEISPKKTIEGSIGGLMSGYVVTLLFKLTVFQSMHWATLIFTPLLVGIIAQVGDLCESFFKRAFDKKDSGTILPGHGGFLDRFDGVVFSVPVMYACIRIFG